MDPGCDAGGLGREVRLLDSGGERPASGEMRGELDTARGVLAEWQTQHEVYDLSMVLLGAALGDRELANAHAARLDARAGGNLPAARGIPRTRRADHRCSTSTLNPASRIALAAASRSGLSSMRTVPLARSTSTFACGSIVCTAAMTERMQWLQVIVWTFNSISVSPGTTGVPQTLMMVLPMGARSTGLWPLPLEATKSHTGY
jgi:hypothetical protein